MAAFSADDDHGLDPVTTVAIVGDTMLGRLCADRVRRGDVAPLFGPEVQAALRAADLVVANLECCVSDRGEPWPDPRKPFFFRAPPQAAQVLAELGVDVVTLANNHALDFGIDALLDTIEHCTAAGIAVVGAGPDLATARAPVTVDAAGTSVSVVPVADHPADFAAGPAQPGIAFADLWDGVPEWLLRLVADQAATTDVVLVTPHWGPNMTTAPLPHVSRAASALVAAGATIVAGHSAHVFHGVAWRDGACVLYDTGDFIDDYAVDPALRNDLGMLWTVGLEGSRPARVEALPLRLDTCRTVLATGQDAGWAARRLERACEPYGTAVAPGSAGSLICCPEP
jgi:poly-gamma-glutamate capsule biosynthesis protein CapA/YwtB (metallophosphatase superfamily)